MLFLSGETTDAIQVWRSQWRATQQPSCRHSWWSSHAFALMSFEESMDSALCICWPLKSPHAQRYRRASNCDMILPREGHHTLTSHGMHSNTRYLAFTVKGIPCKGPRTAPVRWRCSSACCHLRTLRAMTALMSKMQRLNERETSNMQSSGCSMGATSLACFLLCGRKPESHRVACLMDCFLQANFGQL